MPTGRAGAFRCPDRVGQAAELAGASGGAVVVVVVVVVVWPRAGCTFAALSLCEQCRHSIAATSDHSQILRQQTLGLTVVFAAFLRARRAEG